MIRRAFTNRPVLCSCVALALLAFIAWPVYAHCGRCAASAKDMCAAMDAGKMTLAKAIEKAEAHCKGKAVAAYCKLESANLEMEVACLVGDKLMEVELDKAGEVTESSETKAMPGHEEHE